jgi:hypothetical protein
VPERFGAAWEHWRTGTSRSDLDTHPDTVSRMMALADAVASD